MPSTGSRLQAARFEESIGICLGLDQDAIKPLCMGGRCRCIEQLAAGAPVLVRGVDVESVQQQPIFSGGQIARIGRFPAGDADQHVVHILHHHEVKMNEVVSVVAVARQAQALHPLGQLSGRDGALDDAVDRRQVVGMRLPQVECDRRRLHEDRSAHTGISSVTPSRPAPSKASAASRWLPICPIMVRSPFG